jgi:phosphoribosyl 1,2-cyclic phosphodiesterase
MELKVLGSSSHGNGYILTNGNETLIIECGIPLKEVKQALNYNVSSIAGALVSHIHGDHAKYAGKYAKEGINIIAGDDVLLKHKIHDAFSMRIPSGITRHILKGFTVIAFPVSHDVPTFGFHIHHPDMGNLLFLTDTYMSEYTFPDVNHFLIEANYSEDILDENVKRGIVHQAVKDRVWQSHMEIETTKGVLSAHDLRKARDIVLIHLSNDNSNAKEYKAAIEGLTGVVTYTAKKGLEISLSQI